MPCGEALTSNPILSPSSCVIKSDKVVSWAIKSVRVCVGKFSESIYFSSVLILVTFAPSNPWGNVKRIVVIVPNIFDIVIVGLGN